MSTVFSEEVSAMPDKPFVIVPKTKQMPPKLSPFEENIERLAEHLRKAREKNGQTIVQVAATATDLEVPIGKSTVQSLEAGATPNPGIYTLLGVATGLGCQVHDLIAIALGAPIEESAGFKKSDAATLFDLIQKLPSGEQRYYRRALQTLEREMRLTLKQLTESDQNSEK